MSSFSGVMPLVCRAIRAGPASSSRMVSARSFTTVSRLQPRTQLLLPPSASAFSKRAFSLSDLNPFADKSRPAEVLSPLPPSDIPDEVPASAASVPSSTPSATLSGFPNHPSTPASSKLLDTPPNSADVHSVVSPPPTSFTGNFSPASPNLPSQPPRGPSALPTNFEDIAHIDIQIGDLKAMGLNGWFPTRTFQSVIEYLHVFTGLPWWATIVAATLLVRMAVAPLLVGSFKKMAVMAQIQPQTTAITEAMNKAKAAGDMALMQQRGTQLHQHFKKHNVSPFSALLIPITTAVIFMTMFFSVTAMVNLPVPQLTVGGIPGWCYDLTKPDSTYILPILAALGTAATLHLGVSGISPKFQPLRSQAIAAVMKGLSLTMIPVFGGFTLWSGIPLIGGAAVNGFPAGVLLYWATSNTFQVCQALVLRSSWARDRLKLPPTPTSASLGRPILSDKDAIQKAWAEYKVDAIARARAAQDKARAKAIAEGQTPVLNADELLEQKQKRLAYEAQMRAEEDAKREMLAEASKRLLTDETARLKGPHVVKASGARDVQGWDSAGQVKRKRSSLASVKSVEVKSEVGRQLEELKAKRKKAEEMLAAARLGPAKGAKK